MNVRHSTSYALLATRAGRDAGLKNPTPEAVAADESARALRDALWGEYELRLRDVQTHKLDSICAFLASNGVKVGRSSVHRDRDALLQKERSYIIAAEKARAIVDSISADGAEDVLRGGQVIAGQLLFEALANLDPVALEGMTPGQILKMIDTLSWLRKSTTDADMVELKITELQKRFDEKVAATRKQKKGGDGKLSAADIAEIRKAVFGEAA